MNGSQIEHVLQLIDKNMQTASDEATAYIRNNHDAIARSLATTGLAVVHTSTGDLELSVADLEATAA